MMKNKTPNFIVTSEPKAGHAKIFINGIITLSIDTTQMIGFQSYIGRSFWHIDLHFKNKSKIIPLEYDSRFKWEAMLIELGKIDL